MLQIGVGAAGDSAQEWFMARPGVDLRDSARQLSHFVAARVQVCVNMMSGTASGAVSGPGLRMIYC